VTPDSTTTQPTTRKEAYAQLRAHLGDYENDADLLDFLLAHERQQGREEAVQRCDKCGEPFAIVPHVHPGLAAPPPEESSE
jgi:hypothetical protein